MDINSFVAALIMQEFYVSNKQQQHTITLMQNTTIPAVNGLYITVHTDTKIIKVSRVFNPRANTYYDINKAYKVILDEM